MTPCATRRQPLQQVLTPSRWSGSGRLSSTGRAACIGRGSGRFMFSSAGATKTAFSAESRRAPGGAKNFRSECTWHKLRIILKMFHVKHLWGGERARAGEPDLGVLILLEFPGFLAELELGY